MEWSLGDVITYLIVLFVVCSYSFDNVEDGEISESPKSKTFPPSSQSRSSGEKSARRWSLSAKRIHNSRDDLDGCAGHDHPPTVGADRAAGAFSAIHMC